MPDQAAWVKAAGPPRQSRGAFEPRARSRGRGRDVGGCLRPLCTRPGATYAPRPKTASVGSAHVRVAIWRRAYQTRSTFRARDESAMRGATDFASRAAGRQGRGPEAGVRTTGLAIASRRALGCALPLRDEMAELAAFYLVTRHAGFALRHHKAVHAPADAERRAAVPVAGGSGRIGAGKTGVWQRDGGEDEGHQFRSYLHHAPPDGNRPGLVLMRAVLTRNPPFGVGGSDLGQDGHGWVPREILGTSAKSARRPGPFDMYQM